MPQVPIFRQPPSGWGFHRKKKVRCEDCDLRGDLDILGRPRRGEPQSMARIAICQGCGGTGSVVPESTSDPMWTGKF